MTAKKVVSKGKKSSKKMARRAKPRRELVNVESAPSLVHHTVGPANQPEADSNQVPLSAAEAKCSSHAEGPEWDGFADYISDLTPNQLRAVACWEASQLEKAGLLADLDDVPEDLATISGKDALSLVVRFARVRHESVEPIGTLPADVKEYYAKAFNAWVEAVAEPEQDQVLASAATESDEVTQAVDFSGINAPLAGISSSTLYIQEVIKRINECDILVAPGISFLFQISAELAVVAGNLARWLESLPRPAEESESP